MNEKVLTDIDTAIQSILTGIKEVQRLALRREGTHIAWEAVVVVLKQVDEEVWGITDMVTPKL